MAKRKRYGSFAAGLEQRSGLRQVSFAMKPDDAQHVETAKRRFGTLALARFLGLVVKGLVRLCQTADRK